MSVDLLAIVAHPDDAELLCGGTLARAAGGKYRTGILDLSAGELGSSGSPEQRAAEAQTAANILGVAERVTAALPDGAIRDSHQARRKVVSLVRQLRPRMVITHWPRARHPDHGAACRLARASCFLAGLKRFPADGEPHRPHKLLYALTYQEAWIRPSFVVDITDQMEQKLDAIFAFQTQFSGRIAMGDVMPGGERLLREQIRAHHAHYGSWIRREYGEPFWTKEVMAVNDVPGLEVSSF
ncbi:MAG: bacillithiol biosynthesis deacetylase BshB1 [Longimicrobiales bacterium]